MASCRALKIFVRVPWARRCIRNAGMVHFEAKLIALKNANNSYLIYMYWYTVNESVIEYRELPI